MRFQKGHIPWIFGKRHTLETKAKIKASAECRFSDPKERLKQSKAQKQYLTNHEPPHKGRRHTESTKLLISQRAIERFNQPEELRKVLSSRRPTALETRLTNIINNHNLPYRYVGNGDLIIGGKNPDFMNINGAKKLIEVFGVHWHPIFDIGRRIEHFRAYGFDTLIIWEEELANEKAIIHKIREFEKRKHR